MLIKYVLEMLQVITTSYDEKTLSFYYAGVLEMQEKC